MVSWYTVTVAVSLRLVPCLQNLQRTTNWRQYLTSPEMLSRHIICVYLKARSSIWKSNVPNGFCPYCSFQPLWLQMTSIVLEIYLGIFRQERTNDSWAIQLGETWTCPIGLQLLRMFTLTEGTVSLCPTVGWMSKDPPNLPRDTPILVPQWTCGWFSHSRWWFQLETTTIQKYDADLCGATSAISWRGPLWKTRVDTNEDPCE